MLSFLTSGPSPMTLTEVITAVTDSISGVVGWMTSFLSQITTANGLILISFILGFVLFGIHIMKSLMGR